MGETPPPPAFAAGGSVGRIGASAAALIGLFAVASSRTEPDGASQADAVGVGEVYTVRSLSGQSG